ncbi:NnrS family protein [Thiohalobacter sp.]|uniref:NnrS family protein n=1 Tax=Thiohalobacter sp. TaxID=2025948 RepID=UPI002636726F|nr:NnrS family protein [Thiohalobacter sp.]
MSMAPWRLLFPLAALGGGLAPVIWLAGPLPVHLDARWHGHEMLFGFAGAVIGGFLVNGCTPGLAPALALSWLLARAAALCAPSVPVALAGLAYPLLLAGLAGLPLWRSARRLRNRFPPLVLAGLVVLDALWWEGRLEGDVAMQDRSLFATLSVLALLLLVMGGRALHTAVAGALDRAGLSRSGLRAASLEPLLGPLLLAATACLAVGRSDWASGPLLLAGGLALWRLPWAHAPRLAADSRLATLAAGQCWVGVGLLLAAGSAWLETGMAIAAWHGLALGALGTLTLVMMARTAALRVRRPLTRFTDMALATALVAVATIARLAAPVAGEAAPWLAASGWALACLLLLRRLLG